MANKVSVDIPDIEVSTTIENNFIVKSFKARDICL